MLRNTMQPPQEEWNKKREQTQQPHRPLSDVTGNELITVRLLSAYVPPLS